MKFLMSIVSLMTAAFLLSSTASAYGSCTTADPNGHGDRFCVGDVVSSRYEYARGTVTNTYYGGYVDVDWNISGHGYARQLHVSYLSLEPNQPGNGGGYNPPPPPPYSSVVTDANGYQIQAGDVVKYRYNNAVGTVESTYPSSNSVNVRWNIQGSGYGYMLPGTDVIKIQGGGYFPRY